MANELKHGSPGTELTQAEYESIGAHVLDAQATGDLVYASTASQLRRLGIGTTGQPLTVVGGVPTWGGDVALGANKLKTTNLLLKEYATDTIAVRDSADTADRYFRAGIFLPGTQIEFQNDAGKINPPNTDSRYLIFQARDTGVGLVEIARLLGAADPEFQTGSNGNAARFSYAGFCGFFGTAPQAKPTGVAVSAAGIHAALVTLGLIAA